LSGVVRLQTIGGRGRAAGWQRKQREREDGGANKQREREGGGAGVQGEGEGWAVQERRWTV
jgi:hypothetical protein